MNLDWQKLGDELLANVLDLWPLLVTLVVGYVIGKVLSLVLSGTAGRLEKSERPISGHAVRAIARSLALIGFVFGLHYGLKLVISHEREGLINLAATLTHMLAVFAFARMFYLLSEVPYLWMRWRAQRTKNRLDDMLAPIVRTCLHIVVITFALVQVAQALYGQPITSLVAGLGIGGLAVALAAQDSLKNLFGSVVIFLDKPFKVGDRLLIDGVDGPVEEVGLRSTKIRTLEGHLVTIPNGDLANKNIVNIGERPSIRRILNIGITYDTPPEKVDRAVEILKEILDNHEGMDPEFPPRVYFSDFAAASLNLFVIYWYHPPEYWDYMEFSEKVNREILRRFNEEGIDFAFPTQTLYLAGDPSRPLGFGDFNARQPPGT